MTLNEWVQRLRSMSRVSVAHIEPKEAADLYRVVEALRFVAAHRIVVSEPVEVLSEKQPAGRKRGRRTRFVEGTRCLWCGSQTPGTRKLAHAHREGCALG